MTPKDFLKERLKSIFNSIKSINIRYQYCKEHDTHIVEVTPLNEFDNNNEYIVCERDLLFDFNELYFPSTLIFASEESLNRVEVADFSFTREVKVSYVEYDFDKSYSIFGLDIEENKYSNFALAA